MKKIQQDLKYNFENLELLVQAMTHKSYSNENASDAVKDNERLEFLGDAVLDLSISQFLMTKFPDIAEGRLSKMRASLVNEDFLAKLALNLDLNESLRLGKGEVKSGGSLKPRLLASALEAIIGAIFIDKGFAAAHRVIIDLFEKDSEGIDVTEHQAQDYKTQLQEKVQALYKETPSYELLEESGPDHQKNFLVKVFVKDSELGQGEGKSKKQAEQQAALHALEGLS